jgi:hypothetical protein
MKADGGGKGLFTLRGADPSWRGRRRKMRDSATLAPKNFGIEP